MFHHRCILVYLTKLLHTSFVSSILVVKSTKRYLLRSHLFSFSSIALSREKEQVFIWFSFGSALVFQSSAFTFTHPVIKQSANVIVTGCVHASMAKRDFYPRGVNIPTIVHPALGANLSF